MITSTLISFFGGSVFRMIWGELSSFITKWQDHKQELDRIRLQEDVDKAQHARNMESITKQAELQVKTITVQGEVDVAKLDAEGWLSAVKDVGKQIGIAWVDAWNAVIRPAVATWAIGMLTLDEFSVITMSTRTEEICGAALGIYLADRMLFKRGK